jgi:hypothetical protein
LTLREVIFPPGRYCCGLDSLIRRYFGVSCI